MSAAVYLIVIGGMSIATAAVLGNLIGGMPGMPIATAAVLVNAIGRIPTITAIALIGGMSTAATGDLIGRKSTAHRIRLESTGNGTKLRIRSCERLGSLCS